MNTYDLSVRGETVHVEFKKVNDSRRLRNVSGTNKNPNLFGIRAAMACYVQVPVALSPKWAETSSGANGHPLPLNGVGFCTYQDKWSSKRGRHEAIKDALSGDYWITGDLRGEIMQAFLAAEAERMPKVKAPKFTPKTRKPKPGLRATMARMCELLEKLAHPAVVVSNLDPVDLDKLLQPLCPSLIGGVRPAGTATAYPSLASEPATGKEI